MGVCKKTISVLLVSLGFLLFVSEAKCSDEEFIYNDNGKRDPLVELVSPQGIVLQDDSEILITDVFLEGIVLGSGKGNFAIINGKVLKENDRLGPFIVLSIREDIVILSKDRQKFELKLKKEE